MENMENKDSLLVSVDIGTYQTSVVVAEKTHDGLTVLGDGDRAISRRTQGPCHQC